MNYERKYKEALGWMQSLYSGLHGATKEEAEHYFPELKETEDERIRKALTEFLKSASGGFLNSAIPCETFGEWLAWLEKQDEQKHFSDFNANDWYASKVDGKIHNMTYNPTDKVKPKFKVGEWVLNNVCFPVQIASIKDSMYIFTEGDAMSVSFIDENFHLWTIHDAMDGDVLYCKATSGTEFIMVLKNITRYGILNSYCRYNSDDGFDINVPSVMSVRDNPKLATKEQRDFFLQKMKEAGYEWDVDKKELKKIEQKKVNAYKVIE